MSGGDPVADRGDDPIVVTAAGAVRGVRHPGSTTYLGIPYAAPPVGERRFAAPAPPERWQGVRDATAYGATPQRRSFGDEPLIPEPSIAGDDTLSVNVFTPADTPVPSGAALLPVLVWIHGGGFTAGSPASPWYDGAAFARDGVVTVTLSYRLGFDGFGAIPGAPSNRGVRDWLAGLEWVRDNITAFGGDPRRVTIAGQSAGGGAALTLLGMPRAQPLFHAVWAMSPAIADVAVDRLGTAAAKIARLGNVPADRDGFASLPEERILDLQAEVEKPASGRAMDAVADMLDNGLLWGPALDGDLLPRPTLEAIADGVGADKPVVLGTTVDEFTMAADRFATALRWVPASVVLGRVGLRGTRRSAYLRANRGTGRRGTAAVLGHYITDAVFRAPAVRFARARGQAPTWMYSFAWSSPSMGWACHCLDVPFWWDCLDSPVGVRRLAGANPPQALADAVHGSAVELVRGGSVGWPAWSERPGTTRVFGAAPAQPDVVPDAYAGVHSLL